MAERPTETTARSTNGANGAMTREQLAEADRTAFIKGQEFDWDSHETGKPAKPADREVDELDDVDESEADIPKRRSSLDDDDEIEDEDLDDDDADDVDADEDEEEETSDEDLDDEDDEDEEDLDEDDEDDEVKALGKSKGDDKGKPDRETEKRMAQVRKTEERSRAQIAKERATAQADIDRQLAQLKPRIDALEAFEKLKAEASNDPVALLRHFGVDLEYAAKMAHAEHLGATDPKHREAAAHLQRQRKQASDIEALKNENAEIKKREAEREKTAKQQQETDALLGGIAKHAKKTDAPITQKLLAANPARARAMFAQAHLAIWEKTGSEPSARKVIRVCEKMQRRQLRELGVDVAAFAKSTTKTTTKTGDKTTAGKKSGKGKKPVAGSSAREMKGDIVAELESGEFTDD